MVRSMIITFKTSNFLLRVIITDTVPVGGFCRLHEQCTGSSNSEVCENGRCTCTKRFPFINMACEKSNVMQNKKKKVVYEQVWHYEWETTVL